MNGFGGPQRARRGDGAILGRAARTAALLPALLLALGATACDTGTEGPAGPELGVSRLLPPESGEPPGVLFGQAFPLDPGTDDWAVLALGAAGLEMITVDDHEAASVSEGFLTLTDVEASFVRLVLLPADVPVEFRARVFEVTHPALGDPCDRIRLVQLGDVPDGEHPGTAEEALAAMPAPLLNRIKRGLSPSKLGGKARWVSPRDDDGLMTASLVTGPFDTAVVAALIMPAAGEPVFVQSIHGTTQPRLEAVAAQGGQVEQPSLDVVMVGDQSRSSLALPPGTTEILSVVVPAAADRFTVSLAMDPNAPPGAASRWRLDVAPEPPPARDGEAPAEPAFALLASGTLTAPATAASAFEELALRWPAEWQGLGRARVRLSVTGDAAVVLGQPMLLGPLTQRPPNLLFVSLDTLRADHLGCYGYERDTSPGLDALAADAVRFERCVSVGPYTLPTHATLFTGLFPRAHGAVGTNDRLDSSRLAYLPRVLADAGYVSAAFTGGGFLSPDFGLAAGFDRFGVVDPLLKVKIDEAANPRAAADRRRNSLGAAAEWVAEHREQPWFLFVHSYVAHEYEPELEDFQLFDTEPRDRAWTGPLRPHLKPGSWIDDPPRQGDLRHIINLYDATVHFADRQLGVFLDGLRDQGLLEDTLIVVTSDHGEEFFEHGGLRHSVSVYDEMLHVPLIVAAPGLPAGRVVSEPVSQVDIFPTLLELLGLPVPEDLDGHSRVPLMTGTAAEARDQPRTPVYAHVDTRFSLRESLVVGRTKIIHNPPSEDVVFAATDEWELYDVVDDPGEQRNLVTHRPAEFERMREHLEAVRLLQQARAVDGATAEIDAEVMRQLEALGYVR
jgi:arylsulfatase A-like enzyme